jgi:hypothetical protein
MLRRHFALTLLLALPCVASAAQPPACDRVALAEAAETARFNIIAAVDGAQALDAWRRVLDGGGAVGWAVTEYNVDPRSVFVFAFERNALRVYRAGAFGETTDAAMHGCIDPVVVPEAIIPWTNVREIEAGNWVLWFRLREPVEIRSDKGKRKKVKELKAYFHGGNGGDLTYYYNLRGGEPPRHRGRADRLSTAAPVHHREHRRSRAAHRSQAQGARRGLVTPGTTRIV